MMVLCNQSHHNKIMRIYFKDLNALIISLIFHFIFDDTNFVRGSLPENDCREPFENITFNAIKNNTLNITFDPSSILTLCSREYQLEIYDGHTNYTKNCSSIDCLNKITEMKVINETSVLLNINTTNGITLKQCNNYTAFIKVLDPNTIGANQTVTFMFDYRNESDNDWKVNSFQVNATGPNWVLLTWLPPVNYSECVSSYVVKVSNDEGHLLNRTELERSTLQLNVSRETIYDLTPCTKYYFSLSIHGTRVSVNSTINGTTQIVAPGEVSNMTVANITSHSMTIVWTKPSYGLTCALHYALEFTDNSGSLPVIYVSLNETSYVKYNLKPCVQYGIGIRTKGTDKDSQQVIVDGTTSPEVPGPVQTFRISEMGTNNLTLTWTIPARYPECIIFYIVSWYDYVNQSLVNTINITDPSINSLQIGNLEPCWNYTFSIYCGGIIGDSEVTNLSASMNERIPGPVQNVTVARGDFQLVARWKPPNIAVHCISHYVVRSKPLNATETALIKRSVMNTYFSFGSMKLGITDKESDDLNTTKVLLDLIACVDYEIIITAASVSGGESEAVPVTQTTLPHEFSEPSEGKTTQVGRYWTELEWLVPFTNRNLCPLILFVATCYEPEGLPIVWNTTYRDSMGYVRVNATNLKPYTSYTCTARAMNSADWSKPSSQVTFQTLQAAPNAPTNVHVLEKTSFSLEISWDKPSVIPGVLEEYNVSIRCAGPQYSVPETCTSKIITPSYWVTLSGYAEKVLLERLLPYQKCMITVAAATGAGYGPISEPHVTFTLPNVSEVVRDIDVAVLYNESVVMWYAPCFSNGIISYFSITVKGTREGFDPDPELFLNRPYEPDKPDLRYELHLKNLSAEYDYEVAISVFVNSVSSTLPATINFKSSARIPDVPSESSLQIINPNPKATDSPSENAKITLTKTLFSNKDGAIKYLAVLVGHEGLLGPAQSGFLINKDGRYEWPHVRTWANATQESAVFMYQATPAWWNPFKEGSVEDKIDYIIGSESCSKDDINVFCNGPLNPSTSYEMRIRAFTSAGYKDSPSIMFVTDAAFPYGYVIKAVISFFVIIIFVMIVVAFVILRRSSWLAAIKKPNQLVTPQPQNDDEIPDEMYLKELSAKKFLIHCNEILNDINKMKAEFLRLNTLSTQIELSCLAAQLPENKKKNRYINVFPYDSTRVVLEDYNDTDYINASYILDDIDKSIEYIACQAPKDDTIDDFWKMIYQCKVQSIIMLCNFMEQGKQKCYSYIPDDNETVNSDGLTIVCTHKRVYSSHIERILSITKDDQVVSRAVTHFHFVDWPDFGVPAEAETMLNFCKAVRSASIGTGMVAVHCSAGIGRTGTYIATDILLRHIDLSVKINVFRTVLVLREQRANMVQTEVQYSYIYKCLKYALDHPLLYFKRGRSVLESKSRNKHNSRRGSRFSIASSITSR